MISINKSKTKLLQVKVGFKRINTIGTTNRIICYMTNNDKQRVTLFVNPKLLKQAKAQAVVEETSLAALVERALAEYLPKETIIKKTDILK